MPIEKLIGAYNAQMKLPPLENLRIFAAVARLGGFTAAADSLALSHSAVSRRVSELEARLNVQLLQRTSRRVALTPAGKILYEAAQDAFARIHAATSEIQTPARQRPLLVSCERSLAMRWLIPRLSGFQDAHPDIPVYLSTGGGAIDLLRENIDLALRRADFEIDPRVISLSLFPEYIGPVFAAQDGARPANARNAQTRLHTTGRPDAWDLWTRKASATDPGNTSSSRSPTRPDQPGSKPQDQYFDHFFLSLQAAEAGLGRAIAPLFLAIDSLQAGRLAAPAGFMPDGTQYIALLRQPLQANSPEEQFLHWLQGAIAETFLQAAPYQLG